MAHITKIKASDHGAKDSTSTDDQSKQSVVKTKLKTKTETKSTNTKSAPSKPKDGNSKLSTDSISKKTQAAKAPRKPLPKWLRILTAPFRLIAKPFIKLGHYIHDSWIEIRQVSWPNRKSTWQMTGAVLLYAAIFIIVLTLLDMLFKLIFDNLLG